MYTHIFVYIDPLKHYVNCMEAPAESCSEAFEIGCCVRNGSQCVVSDPPQLDNDACFDVPTTTNVAKKLILHKMLIMQIMQIM